MSDITIYHNPRCSKSRQTLALLEARGLTPTIIEYLQTPPSEAEIKQLLKRLDLTPRELMRTKEAVYKEQGLGDDTCSDAQLIKAMHAFPILIERPIVVAGKQARIGRPPEAVLEIL